MAVLPLMAMEILAEAPPWVTATVVLNWTTWLVFVVDVVAKLGAFRTRWLRRPSAWLAIGIVVVSVPVLPTGFAAARLARTARLGRLARIGRLGRFARLAFAAGRARQGFDRLVRLEALPFVTLATIGVVTVGGAALYLVELQPEGQFRLGDALWWAITTVTTVGYGDIVPRSTAGRLVGAAVMVLGIAYTSLLTAELAAYLSKRSQRSEEDTVLGRLDALADEVRMLRESLLLPRVSGAGSGAPSDDAMGPDLPAGPADSK
ncbi:MAG: ion transporter [Ardenticatenales bacterium]|nr:ion transporter [Ardenticatenales bacterium]